MAAQSILFLQSHPSTFGRVLVKQMRAHGIECHIINLSISDWIYRLGLGATNYRGRLSNWPKFLENFIDQHQITDIVYYADQRPYHRIARQIASKRHINAYAYEFGYLRPDWITLEKGGMAVFSHFPDDPDQILSLAKDLPQPDMIVRYPHAFHEEAANEVFYNMAPVFLAPFFPFFDRDRYYHPLHDYPSYIPRLLRGNKLEQQAKTLTQRLIKDQTPYFLIPMQLQADYQIRRGSAYSHLRDMVDEVITSFQIHASPDSRLVFKIHPMDNNIERWPQVIAQYAQKHDCANRVDIIDGGDLAALLEHCQGVVLVNSTTGLQALNAGNPVKTLGAAIYDIPGLTFQDPLDAFWNSDQTPDLNLIDAFTRLLAASIQIKGSFFNKEGQKVAAAEFINRITHHTVNSHGAFVAPPPRLQQAKDQGIPMIYEESTSPESKS